MSDERWLDVNQVARALGVSPQHVRNMISAELIPKSLRRDVGTASRHFWKVREDALKLVNPLRELNFEADIAAEEAAARVFHVDAIEHTEHTEATEATEPAEPIDGRSQPVRLNQASIGARGGRRSK